MRARIFVGLVAMTSVAAVNAAEPIDYLKQVKPLLAEKCFSCHGALKQEGNLRLDAITLIRKGGDNGKVIVAGAIAKSHLIERISSKDADVRMPPEGEGEPFSTAQVNLIRLWIAQGAVAADEPIPADPSKHWAYQQPVRPARRANAGSSRAENDLDRILAETHQEQGLIPAKPASRNVLLRRVYLDLVGLPPTRDELNSFLNDNSPNAYEKAVDQLLASKQHGERWGRHWMDVWRYSDWTGYGAEIRYSRKHIWRWRDWIIESLNADKGYDRMILEMLAADELVPGDDDAARATGFLARNWYKFDRNVWLDDAIDHTGKAFLGITTKCARCHDHKYDPISQQEYYQLRAIFEPYNVRTDRVRGESNTEKDGLVRIHDAAPDTPTYLFVRGDAKRPAKDHPVPPGVPAVVAGPEFKVQPVTLPPTGYYPALRDFAIDDMIQQADQSVAAAETQLANAKKQLKAATSIASNPTKPAATKPTSTKPVAEIANAFLNDDFAKPLPDVWKTVRGMWEYTDGRLVQKQVVSGFSPIVTVKDHPRDFAATVTLKPTGGKVYRSVGIGFDWIADRDFQAIYLSANDRRPTVSAFHRVGGKDTYPAGAVVSQAIKVGQSALLEILVRDDILNIKVDGQLKLAYRLPVSRQRGKFALWTYDASAEFDDLQIVSLPDKRKLAQPGAGGAAKPAPVAAGFTRESAARALALAEKHLVSARAQRAAIAARIEAERAKYKVLHSSRAADSDPSSKQQARVAAKAERLASLADADEKQLAAQQQLLVARVAAKSGDAKSKQALLAAQKKATATRKAFAAAQQAVQQQSMAYRALGKVYHRESTGRRLALARWIADRRNPLTARVAVNHIWLRHFGQPLVESLEDFGLRSPQPALASILDYLAVELMEHDWSMKHIHRLIVTSNAYRMSSVDRVAEKRNQDVDRDNRLFWRMNSRRMEAETVRDSILYVADSLDLTMGGADIDQKKGLTVPRRSVYFRHARERQMKFLTMFDAANPRECYRRQESIRPQQAFALINSSLALEQSRVLAGRIKAREKQEFIQAAFESILSRRPNKAEYDACSKFLATQTDRLSDPTSLEPLGTTANRKPAAKDPAQRARENLVLVLLNHNDFVTIR